MIFKLGESFASGLLDLYEKVIIHIQDLAKFLTDTQNFLINQTYNCSIGTVDAIYRNCQVQWPIGTYGKKEPRESVLSEHLHDEHDHYGDAQVSKRFLCAVAVVIFSLKTFHEISIPSLTNGDQ